MTIIEQALKIMESEFKAGGDKYNSSRLVADYCRLQIGNEPEEVFGVLFMNNQFEMLSFDKLFRGSVTEASIPPRAIARRMFELNASRMVLTHNHPSGDVTPSKADIAITEKFKGLFKEFDCQVVDHIIVSGKSAYSMVERGDF